MLCVCGARRPLLLGKLSSLTSSAIRLLREAAAVVPFTAVALQCRHQTTSGLDIKIWNEEDFC